MWTYNPLYEKTQKKTKTTPMETTILIEWFLVEDLCYLWLLLIIILRSLQMWGCFKSKAVHRAWWRIGMSLTSYTASQGSNQGDSFFSNGLFEWLVLLWKGRVGNVLAMISQMINGSYRQLPMHKKSHGRVNEDHESCCRRPRLESY